MKAKKVLFCGYRDWARNVLELLDLSMPHVEFHLATEPEQLRTVARCEKYDIIAVVGWSWIIEADIVDSNVVVGMHPSALPDYAGGSPIQHQIIDGLKMSKATLFRLSSKLDGGDILCSVDYSLEGHLDEVFSSLTTATSLLLHDFINRQDSFKPTPQGKVSPRRRLQPWQSKLTKEELLTTPCDRLYDLMRCREDPYPNVYVEDETGRLSFKLVEFEPKR